MTKVLLNTGYSCGKLVVEEVRLRRGEVALIELMFIVVGEEFDVKLLRNPDWRFLREWDFDQKSLWAAQAYNVLRADESVRRDVMRIKVATAPEIHSVIYSFGNKYGFKQDRSLRHETSSKLVRRGNVLLDSLKAEHEPIVEESRRGWWSRFKGFFGGTNNG